MKFDDISYVGVSRGWHSRWTFDFGVCSLTFWFCTKSSSDFSSCPGKSLNIKWIGHLVWQSWFTVNPKDFYPQSLHEVDICSFLIFGWITITFAWCSSRCELQLWPGRFIDMICVIGCASNVRRCIAGCSQWKRGLPPVNVVLLEICTQHNIISWSSLSGLTSRSGHIPPVMK